MLLAPKTKMLNLLGFGPTGDLGPLTGYTSKRGKPVFFLKAPPKTPPTTWQKIQRNKFRLVSYLWDRLPGGQQLDWLKAAKAAKLNITGYNLFLWYQQTHDDAVIHTVERQSGITLLPIS